MSVDAELQKLGRALDVAPDRLAMLDGVGEADLRALRAQLGEALFAADKHYFVRVAALARAVPGPLAARLTELALPPLLAARTAQLLEPARAGDLVGRISVPYLADIAAAMDPARAPEVIAAIAPQRVAAVAAELVRRAEWVVIGGFVAQVSADALAACVAQFDGVALLRIGYVLDNPARMDDIGALLRDDQVDGLLSAAAEQGLWAQFAAVWAELRGERVARLARRYRGAGATLHGAFAAAAERGDLPASLSI